MAQRIQATSELLRKAVDGDASASDTLLQFYRVRLERFLAGRLPSASRGLLDTPDLAQEILTRAWTRLAQFHSQGAGSFCAFLRTAALHAVADQYRRAGRMPATQSLSTTPMQEQIEGSTPTPLNALAGNESFAAYERAMAALDVRLRTAIQLRLELGIQFHQIAEDCGYPTAEAARKAVNRGLQELAKRLSEH
jgi:RNA polymerase sigma factor (sigma-70 family)